MRSTASLTGMVVDRPRISLSMLWCLGSRCCTNTMARPESAGKSASRSLKTSSPPAEPPMPATGMVLPPLAAGSGISSDSSDAGCLIIVFTIRTGLRNQFRRAQMPSPMKPATSTVHCFHQLRTPGFASFCKGGEHVTISLRIRQAANLVQRARRADLLLGKGQTDGVECHRKFGRENGERNGSGASFRHRVHHSQAGRIYTCTPVPGSQNLWPAD